MAECLTKPLLLTGRAGADSSVIIDITAGGSWRAVGLLHVYPAAPLGGEYRISRRVLLRWGRRA